MASPLDFNNVQADVLSGLPKKTETFYFFQIDDSRVDEFREQLVDLIPMVTTVAQVRNDKEKIMRHKRQRKARQDATSEFLALSGVNIAFSKKGLEKMGIHDEIGDSVFNAGMLADAVNLGDRVDREWIDEFKQEIHGVILVTGDSQTTVQEKLGAIQDIFSNGEEDATIRKVLSVVGNARPGAFSAHEHFGFLDSISQPIIQGVDTNPNPGQQPEIRQGKILLGRAGDGPEVPTRPSWALDGSFLAFSYLSQKVPEFDWFLRQNPIAGAPPELGSELLGARLVGRWKSGAHAGAPIDLTPLKDDPDLGRDPSRNNNFRYDPLSQERCPYAAHTRKTAPRSDITPEDAERHRIIRHGIQFGPEVTAEEVATNKTMHDRGLLFVAYQSNIAEGFQFIQQKWANNVQFPFGKGGPEPGFDPIIGQQTADLPPRVMSGTNPSNQAPNLTLNEQWVVTKGGEYFFSPSIPSLKEKFALQGGRSELRK